MNQFLPALFSGIAVGTLYGLLAFATVVLFKATGAVNFAEGAMGVLGAFIVYKLMHEQGFALVPAIVAGLAAGALIGVVTYLLVMVPGSRNASTTNLLIRTVAVGLLIAAVIDWQWGSGQPLQFPRLTSEGGVSILGSQLPWATLQILGVAAVLVTAFALFFQRTKTGLLTRAMAESRDVAQLLGVKTRRLSVIAWATATVLAVVVAALAAHSTLLSTRILDTFLLYAFAGAIIMGLDSLVGALIGGLLVGILTNMVATYAGIDWSLIVMFGLLVLSLIVRPRGIFGSPEVRRV